ncbi:hypothetical protein N8I71_18030 [Roseibacterium sp. SDUM158016]|uniref:hypothetical protein n=1 Tax=Roseicyclus sediminis TaxID=2980997 RepID=UPI0021CEA0FB|nr:hypothetical protein [Roseibacterium sp. SDUM158016]MCU4654741.1 hypothetical protein [Roseibacterium sp. SDUM158016]
MNDECMMNGVEERMPSRRDRVGGAAKGATPIAGAPMVRGGRGRAVPVVAPV